MADDERFDQPLFVRDLIRRVHEELLASREERIAAGQSPIFEVDSLVLEVNFVATESKDVRGGVDFKIITAGASGTFSNQQVHKITLSMSSVPMAGDDLLELDGEDPTAFRPRLG